MEEHALHTATAGYMRWSERGEGGGGREEGGEGTGKSDHRRRDRGRDGARGEGEQGTGAR